MKKSLLIVDDHPDNLLVLDAVLGRNYELLKAHNGMLMEDPYVRKGYEAGAIDYFTKPFDPALLRQKVSAYAAMQEKSKLLQEKGSTVDELGDKLRANA